ncbi:hypothetical protein MJ581_03960 [Escherichia coli]|nr:hypothetical protein MJ581_03960 [Escherichia coli]
MASPMRRVGIKEATAVSVEHLYRFPEKPPDPWVTAAAPFNGIHRSDRVVPLQRTLLE